MPKIVKKSDAKAAPKRKRVIQPGLPEVDSVFDEEIAEDTCGLEADKIAKTKAGGSYSVDTIISDLSELKVKIAKGLADLETGLLGKAKVLEELDGKIDGRVETLKRLFKIEAEAGKLEELIKAQEDKSKVFEAKSSEERARWEEERAAMKREREREEEEYEYNKKVKRQREEQEFLKRKETLSAMEDELSTLREQVAEFPGLLAEKTTEAEKKAVAASEERMKVEKIILEKDMEKEREIYKLTLKTLEDKAKDQEARIKALEKDLKDLMAQNQSVASKAIEGIAGMKATSQSEKPQG
ncbi:MAG TPA: hypothetical protein PKJ37_07195 [Acidobacteriota bacterium]|nr:hypothetical protein [Acidobacteriota bacterium]HNT17657.1 hypothetical protein [Acidobacteriota bacterium]